MKPLFENNFSESSIDGYIINEAGVAKKKKETPESKGAEVIYVNKKKRYIYYCPLFKEDLKLREKYQDRINIEINQIFKNEEKLINKIYDVAYKSSEPCKVEDNYIDTITVFGYEDKNKFKINFNIALSKGKAKMEGIIGGNNANVINDPDYK